MSYNMEHMEKTIPPCAFCDIVARNHPRHEIVWQSGTHVAFLDAKPLIGGHLLVVPKKHVAYLFELKKKDYGALMEAVHVVARKLQHATKCKKVGLIVDGFSVAHAHIHLVPLNRVRELGNLIRKPRHEGRLRTMGNKLRKSFGTTAMRAK